MRFDLTGGMRTPTVAQAVVERKSICFRFARSHFGSQYNFRRGNRTSRRRLLALNPGLLSGPTRPFRGSTFSTSGSAPLPLYEKKKVWKESERCFHAVLRVVGQQA